MSVGVQFDFLNDLFIFCSVILSYDFTWHVTRENETKINTTMGTENFQGGVNDLFFALVY